MEFAMVGSSARSRRGRWLGAALVVGALVTAPAPTVNAQSARSREDLVAKLAGKHVRIDQATGRARAITTEEARDLIAAVTRATEAPDASTLAPVRTAAGQMLRLGEHAGHIVVVRPSENGSLDLRCVGSADEAVTFLTEDALPLQ
jgi:hypothetical protein